MSDLLQPGEVRREWTDDEMTATWIDPYTYAEHSATYALEDLAAMQRGEAIQNPPSITTWTLDEQIARVKADQDQILAEKAAMLREHPQLAHLPRKEQPNV